MHKVLEYTLATAMICVSGITAYTWNIFLFYTTDLKATLLEALILGVGTAIIIAYIAWNVANVFVRRDQQGYLDHLDNGPEELSHQILRCTNCMMPVYFGKFVEKHAPGIYYDPQTDSFAWRHLLTGAITCDRSEAYIASPRILQ